jgi:hypothetical protein
MAQPQAFNREVDFTERDGDDTNHAGINAELDAAALSINQIRDNLALIQRDDGGLANGIVGAEQLAPSAFDAVKGELNDSVQDAQTAASQATLAAVTATGARDAANASAISAAQSSTNAANSAAGAATAAQTIFNGLYLGAQTADPATDLNGQPLNSGDFYYNSSAKLFRAYDASIPGFTNATPSGQFKRPIFTAGAGFTPGVTTALTLPSDPVTAKNVFVFFDAAVQHNDQYTTSGMTLTFTSPIPLGVQSVEVAYLEALGLNVPADGSVTDDKVASDAGIQATKLAASDASSGSLFTTVQGFIARVMSSAGAALVGFVQAGAASVLRSTQSKLRETVTPEDFGAVGDGVADDTAPVQAALNTNKSLLFADANYLVGPLTVPAAAAGATYRGAGFWHYGKTRKTRFTARDAGQAHIFKLANGADNISFELMRLDCENKCAKGIDGEFGAFLSLDAVGVYNATEWGIYNKQGLARWRRLFVRCDNATGGGAHLYSDGSIESSEFTRGPVPLRLAAGGNRLTNVWANGGTECCVELSPFDSDTNHINTSIVNLYAGETINVNPKPIIKIAGLASRRVEQVQIAAIHLVCAEQTSDRINIGIDSTYARDVTITGATVLGFTSPTAARHLQNFVRADNTLNLTINGNVVRQCTKNVVVIGSNCLPVNITGNTFSEYATSIAAGTEGAAILIDNTTSYGVIAGNVFDISGSSTVPYAVEGGNAARWVFDDNLIRYASATVWNPATGTLSGSFKRLGGAYTLNNVALTNTTIGNTNVNNSSQNFLSRGQVSAGASSTTTLTTLSSSAVNQSYLITVRQSGSGSNSVAAYVMAFNNSAGAVRIAQSNTTGGALDMNITMSGLSIQLVVGSGYGTTTWDWVLTRLG